MSVSSTDSDDHLALQQVSSRSHSAASTASTASNDNNNSHGVSPFWPSAPPVCAAAAAGIGGSAGGGASVDDEVTRRREQNKVSARRSRVKKKAIMSAVHEVVEQQARSIADLEFKIGTLEAVLADARAAAAERVAEVDVRCDDDRVEDGGVGANAERMGGGGGGGGDGGVGANVDPPPPAQPFHAVQAHPHCGVGSAGGSGVGTYPAVAAGPFLPLEQNEQEELEEREQEELQQRQGVQLDVQLDVQLEQQQQHQHFPPHFPHNPPRQQQYETPGASVFWQPQQQTSWETALPEVPLTAQMDISAPQSKQDVSMMSCGDGSGGSRCTTAPLETNNLGLLDVPMSSVQYPLGMASSEGEALVEGLDSWL